MNKKTLTLASTLFAILIATITLTTFPNIEAQPDVEKTDYVMSENVHAILTLKFRSGTETIDFPIFEMSSGMISNSGPSFEVRGVIGAQSYLHEAMDTAWEMRNVNLLPFNYAYKYFDVDVDFTNDDKVLRTLQYSDCRVKDIKVDTLTDKEEGYVITKSGFAIIDIINFECAGLVPSNPQYSELVKDYKKNSIQDYGLHPYKMGEDTHAVTTFKFGEGTERIDFPVFETKTNYLENTGPSFEVQGTVNSYPLLYKAIDTAKIRGKVHDSTNMGQEFFAVDVDFVKSGKVVRTLQYTGCRVNDYIINTEYNLEEGFTKKNGFAIVDKTNFACNGLTPKSTSVNGLANGHANPTNANWITIAHEPNQYNMIENLHAVTTFTFRDGTETIDFPVFKQTGEVMSSSFPTFELQGEVSSRPLLDRSVDESKARGPSSEGTTKGQELFRVKVDLVRSDETIRSYEYSRCRVSDYQIDTQLDKAEGYLKQTGFVLLGVYDFECLGFKPENPPYDEAHTLNYTQTTQSSLDLKNRLYDWDEKFQAKKNSGN